MGGCVEEHVEKQTSSAARLQLLRHQCPLHPVAGFCRPAICWATPDIDVAGAAREYILELPDDYDASRPYRLIFAWHWRGGTAAEVANGFYGLQQRSEGHVWRSV
jgi:hypothetical protein